MTLRRVFTEEDGTQTLVTVYHLNAVTVATRKQSWQTWGPPLPFDYADDDHPVDLLDPQNEETTT